MYDPVKSFFGRKITEVSLSTSESHALKSTYSWYICDTVLASLLRVKAHKAVRIVAQGKC